MNKQEFRTAISIGLLYLIRMLGLFMVLPVLPIAGQTLEYATPALIGLALGIYGLSQAVLQIPMGLLSDRIGRRSVIAGGLALFILGSVIAAASDSVYGVVAGRLLQGCGAIASSLLALMSDLTRVEHRAKAMAVIGISIGSSFGLSLVLGPFVYSMLGLTGVFLFAAGAGVAGIVILFVLIPEPASRSSNLESQLQTGRISTVLKDRSLMQLNLGIFMNHYLLMASFLVFPLLFQATGRIPDDHHARYYFFTLLVAVIVMGPLMWLSDRPRYGKSILLTAVAACVVSLAWMASTRDYVAVIVSITLFFMAFNLLEVMLPSRVSKVSAAGYRGTAMGVYSSAQFAGTFAGGTVGGIILSLSDISTLLYANAILAFLWLVLSLRIPNIGDIASRTFSYDESCRLTANQLLERLSSIRGVIEVVVIEDENTAYLKVDNNVFDESELSAAI